MTSGPADDVEIIFQMLHDLAGIAGYQESCSPRRQVVPSSKAMLSLAQHQAVARLVDGKRVENMLGRRGRAVRRRRAPARRSCLVSRRRRSRRSRGGLGLAHIGLFDRLTGLAVDLRAEPQAGGIHLAPCATCQLVHRRQPARAHISCYRPAANAPIDTEAKGGRKRVVPTSGIGLPSASAMMARPGTAEVLPLVGRHAERGVALEGARPRRNLRDGRGARPRRSRRAGGRRRPCPCAGISNTGCGFGEWRGVFDFGCCFEMAAAVSGT